MRISSMATNDRYFPRRATLFARGAIALLMATTAVLLGLLVFVRGATAEPNDADTKTGKCPTGQAVSPIGLANHPSLLSLQTGIIDDVGRTWSALPDSDWRKNLVRGWYGWPWSPENRNQPTDDAGRPTNVDKGTWFFKNGAAVNFPVTYVDMQGAIRPLRGVEVTIKGSQEGLHPGQEFTIATGRMDDWGQLTFDQSDVVGRPEAYRVASHGGITGPLPFPSDMPQYQWQLWFEYTLDDNRTVSVATTPPAGSVATTYVLATNKITMPAIPEDYDSNPDNTIAQHYGHSCDWKIPGLMQTFGTVDIDFTPDGTRLGEDALKALAAYDAIREAHDYTLYATGATLSKVATQVLMYDDPARDFEADNAHYVPAGPIRIGTSVGFNVDAIQHEYGHFVEYSLGIRTPFVPLGTYDPTRHSTAYEAFPGQGIDPIQKGDALKLVFHESFADFFSMAAQDHTIKQDGFYGDAPFGSGSPQSGDAQLSTPWWLLNLASGGRVQPLPSLGEDNRATVGRILYQLGRIPRQDGVAPDVALMRAYTERNGIETLEDLYEFREYSVGMANEYQRRVDCLFTEHGVAPEILNPAEGSLVGGNPEMLAIKPGNDRPDIQGRVPSINNRFALEVWNDDYSQSYGELAQLSVDGSGNLAIPRTWWQPIWRAHAGERVHITVRGEALGIGPGDPLNVTTGPYRSCARTVTLARDTTLSVRYETNQTLLPGLSGPAGTTGLPIRQAQVDLKQWSVNTPAVTLGTFVSDEVGSVRVDFSGVGIIDPRGSDTIQLHLDVRAAGSAGAVVDDADSVRGRKSRVLAIRRGEPLLPTAQVPDPMDFTDPSLTDLPEDDPSWAYERIVGEKDGAENRARQTLVAHRVDLTSPDQGDVDAVRDAFEIYDVLVTAGRFIESREGTTPVDNVPTVRTSNGPSGITNSHIAVHVGDPTAGAGVSWDEVLHYYAKWLLMQRGFTIGQVNAVPNLEVDHAAGPAGKAAGVDRAWVDGFADFFAVTARQEMAQRSALPLEQLVPLSEATSSAVRTKEYGYGLSPGGVSGLGEGSQRSVARVLYAMSRQRGVGATWDLAMRSGAGSSPAGRLATFDERVRAGGSAMSLVPYRQYACVLSDERVAPELTSDAPLDLIPEAPGSVSWTRSGVDEMRNNRSKVQVFNADLTTELITAIELESWSDADTMTYQFSAAEWTALRAAAGPLRRARVVVSGRQLASPVTPSADGWYPGCASGRDVPTGNVMIVAPNAASFTSGWSYPVDDAARIKEAALEIFEADSDPSDGRADVGLVLSGDTDCAKSSTNSYVVQVDVDPNSTVDEPGWYSTGDSVPLPVTCEPEVVVPFADTFEEFAEAVDEVTNLVDWQACSTMQVPSGSSQASLQAWVDRLNCFDQWWVDTPALKGVRFVDHPETETPPKSDVLSAMRIAIEQDWTQAEDEAIEAGEVEERHVLYLSDRWDEVIRDPQPTVSGEILTMDSIVELARAAGVDSGGVAGDFGGGSTNRMDRVDRSDGVEREGKSVRPGAWDALAAEGSAAGSVSLVGAGPASVRIHTVMVGEAGADSTAVGLAAGTGGTVERAGSTRAAVQRVLEFIATGQGGPVAEEGTDPPVVSVTTSQADRTRTAVPATVGLSASVVPSAGRTVSSVEWDFDYDGDTFTPEASGTEVSHVFASEFVGSVAVRATDSAGAWRIASAGVYVNAAPQASAVGGPWQVGTVPGAVSFTVPGSDPSGVAHWEWDFTGDADDPFGTEQITDGPDVEHVFTALSAPGDVVRARVVDRLGAATMVIMPVRVFEAPHAVISGGPFTGSGHLRRFTMDGSGSTAGSGGPVVGYEWDWNNDGYITVVPGFPELSDVAMSPTAAVATSARYLAPFDGMARLTVVDEAGNRGSTTVAVHVESHAPTVTLNGNSGSGDVVVAGKVGMPFVVDASATDANGTVVEVAGDLTYTLAGSTWAVPGTSTSTSGRFVVSGFAPGTVTLVVRARDNDGESTTRRVTVVFDNALPSTYPAAAITMSPTGDCASLPCAKSFTAAPTGAGLTYRWDFDGDFQFDATGASASKTWTTPVTRDVLVEVTDTAGRRGYAKQRVSAANPAPVAALAAPVDPRYFLPITFDASGSTDDGAIATYEWDFDDDGRFERITTTPMVTHILWAHVSGRITVKVTDAFGASASAVISVWIDYPTPTPSVPAGTPAGMAPWLNGPYEGLPGTSLTFDASASSVAAPGVSIVETAIDVQGDGVLDYVGPEATWTQQFPTAVEGTTWLRIKDSLGRYAVRSTSLRVNWAPPTVQVAGGPLFTAQMPLSGPRSITFDASGARSHAPGGTIVNWEWVVESTDRIQTVSCGNLFATACGAYWRPVASGPDKAVITKEFSATPGPVHGRVTVTDNFGLTATSEFDVVVTNGPARQVDAGGPFTCKVSIGKCRLTAPVAPRLPVAETDTHAPGYAYVDWLMKPSFRHDPWWRWRCEQQMGICAVGSENSPMWSSAAAFPSWGDMEPTILLRAYFPNIAHHEVHATAQVNQEPNTQSVVFTGTDGAALPVSGYTATTGTPTRLTALASRTNATVVRYGWDVDGDHVDDATTTGPTLDHVYSVAGTYPVEVKAYHLETGTFGRQDGMVWDSIANATAAVTVVEAAQPLVADAGPDRAAQPGVPLTLTGSGTGGTGLTYTWNFGDGTPTGTGNPITHTWTATATRTVTLTVTDTQGRTATDQTIVTVAPAPPVADAGPDQNTITTGDIVTLTGAGSTGHQLTYRWYVDGVLISTSTDPTTTHSWPIAGTQTATLTVTDSAGATATDTVTIVVSEHVTADAGTSRTVTAGQDTVFTGDAWGGSGIYPTVEWNFGDGGTATGMTATHNYTSAGTFTVTLTVHDSHGRIGTDTISVTAEAAGTCPYCDQIRADNPTGWWRLGETSGTTAVDASGHGNHGTYTGTVLGLPGIIFGDTAARINAAGGSRINLPNLNPSNYTNMTLETWVNTTSTGHTLRFMGDYKSATSSTAGGGYLGQNSTGRPGYWIAWPDPDGTGPATAFTASVVSTTRTINDGTWHHIAVTRTPTTLTLHVDGAIDTTYTAPAGTTIPTQPMTGTYLGQRFTTSNTGTYTLDEPAIHNTALTPTRITTHHTTGRN